MAQIAGEASGKFLFGITAENGGGSGAIDNHIYVFSIASGGGLTTFGSPVSTLASPVYLAVSPEWEVCLYLRPDLGYRDHGERSDGGVRVFDRNIDGVGNLAVRGLERECGQV